MSKKIEWFDNREKEWKPIEENPNFDYNGNRSPEGFLKHEVCALSYGGRWYGAKYHWRLKDESNKAESY